MTKQQIEALRNITPAYWKKIGDVANRTAIAALPDLLAEREEMIAALKELLRVDDEWHGSVNSEMAHARAQARSMLKKAEGE